MAKVKQDLLYVAIVVRDYDEAIEFYIKKPGFSLAEDKYVPAQDKRWVVAIPPGSKGTGVLLARASFDEQHPNTFSTYFHLFINYPLLRFG